MCYVLHIRLRKHSNHLSVGGQDYRNKSLMLRLMKRNDRGHVIGVFLMAIIRTRVPFMKELKLIIMFTNRTMNMLVESSLLYNNNIAKYEPLSLVNKLCIHKALYY